MSTLSALQERTMVLPPVLVGPCRGKPVVEQCTACILDTSDYFRGLGIPAKLALQSGMRLVRLERHQALHSEGQPSDRLCILMAGELKLFRSLPDGRHQIHKLAVVPGDVIGCEDLFLDTWGSSARAITPATLCCLTRQDLLKVIGRYPEVGMVIMQTMARDLNAYIRHIASLGQKQAVERLASYLVFMLETHTSHDGEELLVSEALTRNELAELLGITSRTLIRSLRALEREGVIALARGAFIIRNRERLARLAEGEAAAVPV